ncbi:MAG: lysine--tRNA ligase [Candidatus Omnitrophica bacterium]|nr:lysine--tRNA ligase [Candidatus Omnitrophota bacterium]
MEKKYEFWTDKIAREIVERKKFHFTENEVPKLKKIVVKSAASVSGVLHIGRLSDTIRCEAVYRSLKDAGFKAELIWTADNVDPLRKIPKGVPENYRQYIGMPVTEIPDPEGCHKSYEEHHKSAYLEVVSKFIQSKMKIFSMREEYLKGTFKKEIKTILKNYDLIVQIQNKYRTANRQLPKEWSPWQPICENCGKIITPRVTKIEDGKIYYVCKDYKFKTETAIGCGHEGIDDPMKGNGKLLYKGELASQWFHWKVCSEGFGKEYIVPGSAFWINGEIIEKVFKFPMPVPIFYEHLIIDGKKMSASIGNIVYPSDWLRCATPELLRLLFLKDPMRVRDFRWSDIPRMFDEYDNLEKIYFGKKIIENKRDKITLSRLFEMIQVRPIEKTYQPKVPFDVLLEIIKISPEENQIEFVLKKLKDLGYKKITKKIWHKIEERLNYVKNWYEKFREKEKEKIEISDMQKNAIKQLIETIKIETDGEKLQVKIFEIARSNNVKPVEFFKLIYQILLNSESGPRLGPYIIEVGKEEVIKKLKECIGVENIKS